jgi:hypothetical protein
MDLQAKDFLHFLWIFKVKYNTDGTIDKYKARLCGKGFTQTFGVNYFETYSPVLAYMTLRTFALC